MIVVLAMAAAIWGIGAAMGAPVQARRIMLALLLVAVLAVQVALPDGHPLREATGSSPALWLLIVAGGALVWGYAKGLRALRARTAPPAPEAPPDDRPRRYARHITLREIGGAGQARLTAAKVLVVGAGGLGAPAILYLAAAGVGRIGIIDPDAVELSNLQRQIAHGTADVGRPKAQSAADAAARLNPHVEVRTYTRAFDDGIGAELVADYDLVLDGTDSADAKAAINRACVTSGVPLITGALSPWEGQLAVLTPGGPCRACLFPADAAPGLAPSCAEAGVAGPLPGVIGAMMALEAVKLLTKAADPPGLLLYDGLHATARTLTVARRPGCPVCGPGWGLHNPPDSRR